MHIRTIWAIVRKDTLDIWKNKPTLAGLIYPIIMALLYLLISRLVGTNETKVLVYNPGSSPLAQVILNSVNNGVLVPASSAGQVEAAFGPNGAKVKSDYMVGLVLPADFESSLRSGSKPTVTLFINGKGMSISSRLLETVITDYARTVASPQPPVNIVLSKINPPSTTDTVTALSQIYTPLVLLLSLTIGATFIPLLLLEEKEKKTLRMLLVSPASFRDILIGKLLVVLVFQLLITSVSLAILRGFSGNVLLVVVYVILGAVFSLSLGLFFGSVFTTTSSANAAIGFVTLIFILGGLFVGQLGELLGRGPILVIVRLLPTYYLADGLINAIQRTGTLLINLLDMGIVIGCVVILLAISVRALRRQVHELAIV